MAHPSKAKGDRTERELQTLLFNLLGYPVRRKLGAGRKDDMGDMDGLPDTTIQVTANQNITAALRYKPIQCELQQARAGTTFGFTVIRLHGPEWRFVQTPDQLATMWREAQPIPGPTAEHRNLDLEQVRKSLPNSFWKLG